MKLIAGRITDGSNGDVAIDQYHRYKVEKIQFNLSTPN
jgi:hypothetical protein